MSDVKVKREATWTIQEPGHDQPTLVAGGSLPGMVSLKRDGQVMHFPHAVALMIADALREATRITNQ
jgi:hypothetical protein